MNRCGIILSYVWYASYGSNLLRARFLCYIQGGCPDGAAKTFLGCTNKTPPRTDKTVQIPHELYFAKTSSVWENGGVTFIRSEKNDNSNTLGRMYLITSDQFIQVVRQENAHEPDDESINVDHINTIEKGQSMVNGSWYRRIIFMGYADGYPIFTFTGGWEDSEIVTNAPAEKYLKTIIKGLKETYGMSNDAVVEYLVGVDGIRGLIDKEKLMEWVLGVDYY